MNGLRVKSGAGWLLASTCVRLACDGPVCASVSVCIVDKNSSALYLWAGPAVALLTTEPVEEMFEVAENGAGWLQPQTAVRCEKKKPITVMTTMMEDG